MNIQNLMNQLGSATNPMALLMSMLNPNQKQLTDQFKNKSKEEQCQQIAEYCNQNGISKEKLEEIIKMLNKNGLKWEIALNKSKEGGKYDRTIKCFRRYGINKR